MKKSIAIALALVFVLALMAACKPQETPNASQDPNATGSAAPANPTNIPTGDLKYEKYFNIMNGGKYYMESTMYTLGIESSAIQAFDGENYDQIVDTMGMTVHTLLLDETIYTIDDETKTYTTASASDTSPEEGGFEDYNNLTFSSSGNAAIAALAQTDTKEYYYEELKFSADPDSEELDCTIRYYFDGEELIATEVTAGGFSVTMVIDVFSETIPEGMLAIPEGYANATQAG